VQVIPSFELFWEEAWPKPSAVGAALDFREIYLELLIILMAASAYN
jgi:hypothetical protein